MAKRGHERRTKSTSKLMKNANMSKYSSDGCSVFTKYQALAEERKERDKQLRNMNTLRRLNIELHHKQYMPGDVLERNVDAALNEIERDQ